MGHLPTHLKEGVPGSSFREGSEEGDCGPDQVSILEAGGGGGGTWSRWLVGFLDEVLKPGGKSGIPRDV